MDNLVSARGKRWWVCEYTGCCIFNRFFVPESKENEKHGTFATLPILLRAVMDQEGGETKEFLRIKQLCQDYYQHPDIPVQPALSPDKLPLNLDELAEYLSELDKGFAWMLADHGEVVPPVKKQRFRR